MSVYNAGEVERVEGDKVIRRTKLRFVLKYKDVVKECVSQSGDLNVDCGLAIKEVAKATHYSVPYKALREAISELRDKYAKEEAVSIVDYVRRKYPKEFEEITRDPFAWILDRTKEIVGYERLKLLTFLSIVSSQIDRVDGMSRVHLLLVGPTGAGKSSTVKRIVELIENTDIYIFGTRVTQNALGYLDVKSLDGKVIFIDQIDRQMINYLREMMTESKITTLVTEKVVDEEGRERFVTHQKTIPGQATVISTSVVDTIDVDREQLFNRFLKVYVNPKSVNRVEVNRSIWKRKPNSGPSQVDKLVFLAYLYSRPKFADADDLFDRAERFLQTIGETSREPNSRVTEVLRNLVIAVAVARGKTKADDSDFDFVMQHFQLDILYNGLGLSERDIEFILALPDHGGVKTDEVADKLKESKQYVLNVLKNLERKGVVEGVKYEGEKTFTWYLTDLGRRIKALVSGVERGVIEVRDEKGETVALLDPKFRPDDERGGDRTDAVPADDGGGVSRNEAEVDRGAQEVDPQFRDFVIGNDGMKLSFDEIYSAFLDREKTRRFVDWCVENGYCEVVEENGVKKYRVVDRGLPPGGGRKTVDRVAEAYEHLKRAGRLLAREFQDWYGEGVIEALKREGKIVFEEIDGELYVKTK
jgi:DNA-binding MarR family transcriptional regulator/ABC-type dipeptide/oligopeptide/nickel transport system ATPase component